MSSLLCCQVASLGQVAFVPRLALRQAGRRPGALVSSLDACLALGGFALFFGWPDLTKTLRLPGALTKLGPEPA